MINLACPKCQSAFQLGDEFRGMTVQCGSCGGEFIISTDGAAIPVESPNIEIVCPGCRTTHVIPGDARGAEAECMVCQISFIVPETGDQGIAVGPAAVTAAPPAPAPVFAAPPPAPAPAPFPAPAAHKPEGATASGIMPSAPGGIDYKNTSTIRLTRSSLFSGKPGAKTTPFGSGLIPPVPPTGVLATEAATPAPRPSPAAIPPPRPAPAVPAVPPPPPPAKPAMAPAPAAPPPPPAPAKPSTSTTGKIPAAKAAAKAASKGARPASASPILAAKASKAGVRPEAGETVLEVKELSGEVGMPWLNLVLALMPVILLPVFVLLASDDKLGAVRSAGIGAVISLACWMGIIWQLLAKRETKVAMVVTDRRTIMAGLGATTEVRLDAAKD